MEQFEKKDEYLELLKNQIRCRKAKNMVAEEIDRHIEDQRAAFIEEGYEETDAMIKTLEQMGDPLEVGNQLNKIHKPRLEWHILIIVLELCSFGILAQLSIKASMGDDMLLYGLNIGKHLMFLVMGILVMTAFYYLDYSFIGKYPKAIWFILLAGIILFTPFGREVNGQRIYLGPLPNLYSYGQLFVPVYGGILYANRKKGYRGIVFCLLLSLITGIIEMQYITQSSVYLGLILSSLVMLTVAVMKDWFHVAKAKALMIIWGWIPVAFIAALLLDISLFSQYQLQRLRELVQIILNPGQYPKGYQMNMVREALSHTQLFGGTAEFTIGYLPGIQNDYVLTYVMGKWGIIAGVLLIVLFALFIGRMIYLSLHQKNTLGSFIGLGCSLVFGVQGGIYILANLGIQLVAQVNLPFVSYGGSGLLVNFVILGVMLSVFRNTNIIKEVPYKSKYMIRVEKVE